MRWERQRSAARGAALGVGVAGFVAVSALAFGIAPTAVVGGLIAVALWRDARRPDAMRPAGSRAQRREPR